MEDISHTTSENRDSFFEEVLNNLPASVHVTQLDEDLNTLPVWVNNIYEKITECSIHEMHKLGYANKGEHIYHPDDFSSIKKNIKYLINHPKHTISLFFRIKKPFNNDYKWIYMLVKVFKKTQIGYQLICLGVDIDNRMACNQHEMNVYLKETFKLKNRIKLSKLTKTEIKVIANYSKSYSTKEVASKLNRSYETINNHKRNIFRKMGFHKVTELVSFAEECGL